MKRAIRESHLAKRSAALARARCIRLKVWSGGHAVALLELLDLVIDLYLDNSASLRSASEKFMYTHIYIGFLLCRIEPSSYGSSIIAGEYFILIA